MHNVVPVRDHHDTGCNHCSAWITMASQEADTHTAQHIVIKGPTCSNLPHNHVVSMHVHVQLSRELCYTTETRAYARFGANDRLFGQPPHPSTISWNRPVVLAHWQAALWQAAPDPDYTRSSPPPLSHYAASFCTVNSSSWPGSSAQPSSSNSSALTFMPGGQVSRHPGPSIDCFIRCATCAKLRYGLYAVPEL
jgi:hypothetical protein